MPYLTLRETTEINVNAVMQRFKKSMLRNIFSFFSGKAALAVSTHFILTPFIPEIALWDVTKGHDTFASLATKPPVKT